jgi:hypothetical protein
VLLFDGLGTSVDGGTYACRVKPLAPEISRKGAVVRVAGDPDDSSLAASAYAISFVDLRFADGHVERWLESGSLSVSSGVRSR